MNKQDAINAFGSVISLAKAVGCSDKYIYKIKEFTFGWKLRVIGAAFLLGLVEQLDLDEVRAEINARTKPKTDAL